MIQGQDAAPAAPRRATVASLDLLRLCAALLVVAYHFLFFSSGNPPGDAGIRDVVGFDLPYGGATPFTWWGWIGVEVFFVISGFVITMSAQGKSAVDFAVGRIVRLYPALIVFSLAALAVVVLTGVLPVGEALVRWQRTIILFPRGPWIDGVIWTLSIEVIFYGLIFAMLVFGQGRRIVEMQRVWLLVLAVFWSIVVLHGAGVAVPGVGPAAVAFSQAYGSSVLLISTGPFFLLGMFTYEIFQRGLSTTRAFLLSVCALCCLAAVHAKAARALAVLELGQSAWTPVVIWTLLLSVFLVAIFVERRRAAPAGYVAIARRLGVMTYPLYLMHNMTGGWILGHLARAMNPWLAAFVTGVTCLAVSYGFAMTMEPAIRRVTVTLIAKGRRGVRRFFTPKPVGEA